MDDEIGGTWMDEMERRWIAWKAQEDAMYIFGTEGAPSYGAAPGFSGSNVVYTTANGTTVMTSDGRMWADRDFDGTIDMEIFYNSNTGQLWGDTDQNGTFDTLFGGG